MDTGDDVHALSPAALAERLHHGSAVLVDVREPGEFAVERIPGAVSHPLSSFDPSALPPGPVVFQCGSGKRSLTAIERSVAAGVPHTTHLAGGLQAWKQAGLPTQRG